MGGTVSFCPSRQTDSMDHQHARRCRRCHCLHTHHQSAATSEANADTIAALASRNLLVIVDAEDSPIKNRAEYAMSPTVAERIEQEVEDELRRRRQCAEEEMTVDEADINTSEQKSIDMTDANYKRKDKDIEYRDEVQHTDR